MKNTIHYVFILDQSGSMIDLKNEVILSYNEQVEMILKLMETEAGSEIKLTLCTFNNDVDFNFINQGVDHVKKLTKEDYLPNSSTALYDAIGTSFLKISELIKPNDQVFFAIFTDGLENASKFYSAEDINYKIKNAEKNGWNVKFFCRYEDRSFYKNKLHISDDLLCSVTLNKVGFKLMENEISYKLKSMVNKQNS